MWSTSLASHQKTFQALAAQVSRWDRQLVENSGKISALYGRCFQAERDVAEVERQLSATEHGQQDLEAVMDRYEGMLDEMLEQSGGEVGAGGVDLERERTYVILSLWFVCKFYADMMTNRYKTAEACSNRLTEMGHSLTDMIEEVNLASSKVGGGRQQGQTQDDPLAQIVRVLNAHLTQLQTIDSGATALQQRVDQAQKEARVLGQGAGVNAGAGWVEGFGRSYLGRS